MSVSYEDLWNRKKDDRIFLYACTYTKKELQELKQQCDLGEIKR
jgi:hypothetical protein